MILLHQTQAIYSNNIHHTVMIVFAHAEVNEWIWNVSILLFVFNIFTILLFVFNIFSILFFVFNIFCILLLDELLQTFIILCCIADSCQISWQPKEIPGIPRQSLRRWIIFLLLGNRSSLSAVLHAGNVQSRRGKCWALPAAATFSPGRQLWFACALHK